MTNQHSCKRFHPNLFSIQNPVRRLNRKKTRYHCPVKQLVFPIFHRQSFLQIWTLMLITLVKLIIKIWITYRFIIMRPHFQPLRIMTYQYRSCCQSNELTVSYRTLPGQPPRESKYSQRSRLNCLCLMTEINEDSLQCVWLSSTLG